METQTRGVLLLLYAHDFSVCGTYGAVRIGGNDAFGISEEMQGEPDSHEGEYGQQCAAEQGEDDGADCGQEDDRIAFWRDGAVGFAHDGMTSGNGCTRADYQSSVCLKAEVSSSTGSLRIRVLPLVRVMRPVSVTLPMRLQTW